MERKPEQTEWEIEGGRSNQGNDENFKAIFCYIPGVVKGPDDVAVNRTEQT